MTYGTVGVALRRRNDCLNPLPTLCICLKNSLSDIFCHSLLNFALIRCSSCINSGSLRRILDLPERLLKDGHFVRVLDNFSSGKEENLSFAFVIRGSETVSRHCEEPLRGDEAIPLKLSTKSSTSPTAKTTLQVNDIRDYATLFR